MLNISHTLNRMDIDTNSIIRAVQQVREIVGEDKAKGASRFIKSLLSLDVKFDDENVALATAQYATEAAIKANGEIGDEQVLLDGAQQRAVKFVTEKGNAWMFARDEATAPKSVETKAFVEGLETKVAVRKDGSIARGGKQTLAAELFRKHVLESTTPCDNACFVNILVKELDMTKAGARTYAHSLRAKHGMVNK